MGSVAFSVSAAPSGPWQLMQILSGSGFFLTAERARHHLIVLSDHHRTLHGVRVHQFRHSLDDLLVTNLAFVSRLESTERGLDPDRGGTSRAGRS